MYLAFKWLILMSVGMWALLCFMDTYLQGGKEINSKDPNTFSPVFGKNSSHSRDRRSRTKTARPDLESPFPSTCFLHYVTFCAGAMVVTIYNRKQEILAYIKEKSSKTNFRAAAKKVVSDLNQTADYIWVAILKKCNTLWDDFKRWLVSLNLPRLADIERWRDHSHRDNSILLKRLKEVGQERNNLGHLLISAIQENRNIRTQSQLDNLAKHRLLRQIQDTQKQIRDNRSRYVNFQQLYLVTHQENVFLKCHIKRLTKEKEETDHKMKILINQVLQSTDSNLKMFCTNVVAKSKINSAFGDANEEVMNFLHKSRKCASTSHWSMSAQVNTSLNRSQSSWPISPQSDLDEIVSISTSEPRPKLKGLPGEYVWTVKDRDGIIEKLYEYDYGYDFDNGDTIRRIREYSVYHDKDCLLDLNSKSTTIIHGSASMGATRTPRQMPSSFGLPSNRNFLTGSPIFQKFLENNKNIVLANTQNPQLLCR